MKNCIFADEHIVCDKINYLLTNPNKLAKVTDAGFELVQSKHTLKQRDQIYQWFQLNKIMLADEKIIQDGPFSSLKLVKKATKIESSHIFSNGLYLEQLNKGSQFLSVENYDAAEESFLKCLSYIPWMSEPKVKLAICCLFKGDAQAAINWIKQPIQNVIGQYEYSEPDPVEWAYYLIALLCNGELAEAAIMSNEFKSLNHQELIRARMAIDYLQTRKIQRVDPEQFAQKSRASIHVLPDITLENWLLDVCTMLQQCKQMAYSDLLANLSAKNPGQNVDGMNAKAILKHFSLEMRIQGTGTMNKLFAKLNIPNRRTGLPSINFKDYLIRIYRWSKQLNS
jgi:tetratricopeptide (TPR) repeat protein